MSVTITVPSYLERYLDGKPSVDVEGHTVGQCLQHLVARFPQISEFLFSPDGSLLDYVSIFINMEDAYPEQLGHAVSDGAQIDIIYVIGGG